MNGVQKVVHLLSVWFPQRSPTRPLLVVRCWSALPSAAVAGFWGVGGNPGDGTWWDVNVGALGCGGLSWLESSCPSRLGATWPDGFNCILVRLSSEPLFVSTM